MSDSTTRQDRPEPEERLDSWKAIASYLNRDVTTVQRWEKRESMPVHRHLHDKLGSVYAFRSELDAWVRSRKAQPGPAALEFDEGPVRGAPATRTWPWLAAALVVCALVLAMGRAALRVHGPAIFRGGSPIDLRIESVTDFDGREQAAAISPRRAVRRISVGPRRPARRVGESSRVRAVPQSDPRLGARAAQSVGTDTAGSRPTVNRSRPR